MDWATAFIEAHQAQTPYPRISISGADIDMAAAYRIQHEFVQALPGKVIGYKAALTAPPAQKALGVDKPAIGVLFDWGVIPAGGEITPDRSVVVETELGFRLNQDVDAPVTEADADAIISTCHPMLEIASANLDGPPRGIDLVATNTAFYRFVEGPAFDAAQLQLDAVGVTLQRDKETLLEESSGSVMGGQRRALAFLIAECLSLGYPLRSGMLLMTGSIGAPQPGRPGLYIGAFDGLAEVSLTLTRRE